MTKPITIGLVLPDVLGTYGDDGNALVLRQRARMRDIPAEILPLKLGDPVPDDLDAYTLGGGEDTAQVLAADHLRADGGLARAAANGRPILAVCAGMQVLGHTFRAHGKKVDGLSLIDATTASQPSRSIGEVSSTPTRAGITAELTEILTGFENHLGGTVLGPEAQPLGTVRHGNGNTTGQPAVSVRTPQPEAGPASAVPASAAPADATPDPAAADAQINAEGAVQGSVIATYMHGPVLARNPQLADLILAKAMGVPLADLAPLELPEVDRLRLERLR